VPQGAKDAKRPSSKGNMNIGRASAFATAVAGTACVDEITTGKIAVDIERTIGYTAAGEYCQQPHAPLVPVPEL
jgi:hypothetical protein